MLRNSPSMNAVLMDPSTGDLAKRANDEFAFKSDFDRMVNEYQRNLNAEQLQKRFLEAHINIFGRDLLLDARYAKYLPRFKGPGGAAGRGALAAMVSGSQHAGFPSSQLYKSQSGYPSLSVTPPPIGNPPSRLAPPGLSGSNLGPPHPPSSRLTESTMFKTPGMYENERRRQREEMVKLREKDFSNRVNAAKHVSPTNSMLPPHLMPLSWSIAPRKVGVLEAIGGPIMSVEKEIVGHLLDKINKTELEVRAEQRKAQMISTSVHQATREIEDLGRDRDRMMDNAAKMNSDHEIILNEVDEMKRQKADLIHRLERRREELLHARRENTSTSRGDEDRRTVLQEQVNMMQRLAKLKGLELYRNRSSYEQLERDYQENRVKKSNKKVIEGLRKKASPIYMSGLDRSMLDKSMLEKSALMSQSRLSEPNLTAITRDGSARPRSRVNLSRTLGRGEGMQFLRELNRDLEDVLSSNSTMAYIKY